MKFLCLPGAGMGEETFRDLSPVIKDLQSDSNATFRIVNGPYEMTEVPIGFNDYLDPPPNYTFFSNNLLADAVTAITLGLDHSKSPEETSRVIFPMISTTALRESVVKSLAMLKEIVEKEGPFDVLLGYSEGSLLASTLLYARMQSPCAPTTPDFKCAIFFAGFAPFSPDGSKVVLADEYGEQFEIPTCHVVGSDDPLISGAISLYNLCNPLNRVMVETGSNHLIIWDQENLVEIPKAVRKFISGVVQKWV